MSDLRADPSLLLDPPALLLVAGVLGVDDLDRDTAAEPAIAGSVDVARAANADDLLEGVAAVEEPRAGWAAVV